MKKLSWSGFLKSDFFRRDRSPGRNVAKDSSQHTPVVSTLTDPSASAVSSSYMSLDQWSSKVACMNGTRSISDFRSESTLNLKQRLNLPGFLNLKCVPGFQFSKRGDPSPDSAEVKPSKSSIFNSLKRKLKGNLKTPSEYSRFKSANKRQTCYQTPALAVERRSARASWQWKTSTATQQSSSIQCTNLPEVNQNSVPLLASNLDDDYESVPPNNSHLGSTAEEPKEGEETELRFLEQPVKLSPSSSGNLAWELFKLEKFGWYWGRMTRSEAERKLADEPDGAFLVRDSSDECHLLSLSFRCYGRTLHTRIEHRNGLFSCYAYPGADHYSSVSELIEYLMNSSRSGIFCYPRSRSPGSVSYPVQLSKPVSRFSEVLPLQFMCHFVIRQYVRMDHIEALPLPESLKAFVVRGDLQMSP